MSRPGLGTSPDRANSPTSIISTPTKSPNLGSAIAPKKVVPIMSDDGVGDEEGVHDGGVDEDRGNKNKVKTSKQTLDDDDDEEDDDNDDLTKGDGKATTMTGSYLLLIVSTLDSWYAIHLLI